MGNRPLKSSFIQIQYKKRCFFDKKVTFSIKTCFFNGKIPVVKWPGKIPVVNGHFQAKNRVFFIEFPPLFLQGQKQSILLKYVELCRNMQNLQKYVEICRNMQKSVKLRVQKAFVRESHTLIFLQGSKRAKNIDGSREKT